MLDGAGARAASPKTVPKGCARRRQFRAANKAAKHPGFSVPEPLPFGTVLCRISELGGLTRFTGFCGARARAQRTLLNAKDFGGYFRVSGVLVVPALQEFPRGGRVDLRALGVSDVFGDDRKLDRLVIGLVPIAGDHTLSPPRSIDLAHALGIFASPGVRLVGQATATFATSATTTPIIFARGTPIIFARGVPREGSGRFGKVREGSGRFGIAEGAGGVAPDA